MLWNVENKQSQNNLQTFVSRCLRRIFRIRLPDIIWNLCLWKINEKEVTIEFKNQKCNWIGHTLSKEDNAIEKMALDEILRIGEVEKDQKLMVENSHQRNHQTRKYMEQS